MKKKVSLILMLIILVQVFSIFSTEKAEAAPLTKNVTHTITGSWSNSKDQGADSYYYDDGLYYGTLTRTSTTWETRTSSSYSSRTGYRNSTFDEDNPSEVWSFSYMRDLLTNDYGYKEVQITSMYWTGGNEGPGEYTFQVYVGTYPNGYYETRGPYKYRRSFRAEFNYTQFRFTSTYSGTVTARTIPPTIRLLNPVLDTRHHNQDKIIVEGFVKDEDIGDKNTIYYSMEGTSHINKNIVLVEPIEIIAKNNEIYFKGHIQLDQSLSPGNYNLKIWAKDDKGADSNVIEIIITVYNLLEEILNNLRSYTFKQDELQFIAVNSNVPVLKSNINDNLIIKIKKELLNKNIMMYFIGNSESKNYINTSLLGN